MTDDLLAPESRHNRHVTTPEDVVPVGGWSREELFDAVRTADRDGHGTLVVIDYGRSALYLAVGDRLRYDPPRALGVAAPPALHVPDPVRYDPATGETSPVIADDPAVTDAARRRRRTRDDGSGEHTEGERGEESVDREPGEKRAGEEQTGDDRPSGEQTATEAAEESRDAERATDGRSGDEPTTGRATAEADGTTDTPGDERPTPADGGRLRAESDTDQVVSVTPQFGLLVPAFDWEEQSDENLLPPVERRSEREAGAGTGASD